jgi:hypothetical protein
MKNVQLQAVEKMVLTRSVTQSSCRDRRRYPTFEQHSLELEGREINYISQEICTLKSRFYVEYLPGVRGLEALAIQKGWSLERRLPATSS